MTAVSHMCWRHVKHFLIVHGTLFAHFPFHLVLMKNAFSIIFFSSAEWGNEYSPPFPTFPQKIYGTVHSAILQHTQGNTQKKAHLTHVRSYTCLCTTYDLPSLHICFIEKESLINISCNTQQKLVAQEWRDGGGGGSSFFDEQMVLMRNNEGDTKRGSCYAQKHGKHGARANPGQRKSHST